MDLKLVVCLIFTILTGCHSDNQDTISHLVLIDNFPETIGVNATPDVVIRTNFSGTIEFLEAEQFKVLLSISASSIQEAYAVGSSLEDQKGSLLLQVYQKPVFVPTYNLQWIVLVVGCIAGSVFLLSTFYVIWWYSQDKHRDLFKNSGYLKNQSVYRSHNSMQLGAAAADFSGSQDQAGNDEYDGEEETERRKLRSSQKPETIFEESEESADDDRTNPKSRMLGFLPRKRSISQRVVTNQIHSAQDQGSSIVDYSNQSGNELENDLSPDQRIAVADGCYTPLDELEDSMHEPAMQNFVSTAKIPDSKVNLGYNIHTSKSDGDLLGDQKKLSEKEKVIHVPLKIALPKQRQSPAKVVIPQNRAEPNFYQRGLNPRSQENDLSSSPASSDRIKAQVHTPENPYINSNNSFGQYIELKSPENSSRSRNSCESNDAYELYTYPADLPMTHIPMSTFKTSNTSPVKDPCKRPSVKRKPIFESGSPTNFDFTKLIPKVDINPTNEPCSPGKFSMLSEDMSGNEFSSIDSDGDLENGIMHLDDSDIDNPSAKSKNDDELSNASLPLPSPPSVLNKYMPYEIHERISQLSPQQSLATSFDGKEYGTLIALTGSPSPGGPFSKHSVNDQRFVFPPPPSMYNPPQQPSWTRNELSYPGPSSGEYIGLPMNLQSPSTHRKEIGDAWDRDRRHFFDKRTRTQSGGERECLPSAGERECAPSGAERERKKNGSDREQRHSFGKKKSKIPRMLHLTILTMCCVLSILSGVYCTVSPKDTIVNIVVYVPRTFHYKNCTIFSAMGRNVRVVNSDGMKWLVTQDPILWKLDSALCETRKCQHGCDDNTGQCICRHGFSMVNGKCQDINECQTAMVQCSHPAAGCANTDGSYECLCSVRNRLYKYEDKCLDCNDPCPSGKYEVQPCLGENNQKICKECTQSCGDFFMQQPCSDKKDAVCLMCQSKCDSSSQFEFSQCSLTQNRECKDKVLLPKPEMSDNVVLDDLASLDEKRKQKLYLQTAVRFVLFRGQKGFGSQFTVNVEMVSSEALVLFQSVNHSDAMSLSDFPNKELFMSKYCQYPMPEKYELKLVKHDNVLYREDTLKGQCSFQTCESSNGQCMNFSTLDSQSIICSDPSAFSEIFRNIIPNYYQTSETVWEEKSEKCKQQHASCETCSKTCAQKMASNYESDECSITNEDDTGLSPRLPMCFSCCMKKECSGICTRYHNSECSLLRCQKGNLTQLLLKPFYPGSDNFYCHIHPILGQNLLTIKYTVELTRNKQKMLLSRNLTLRSDKNLLRTGKVTNEDDIIHAEIDSQIREMPELIHWSLPPSMVKIGRYRPRGNLLSNSVISENSVFIQPDQPFGINPKMFGKQSCENIQLTNIVVPKELETVPLEIIPDLIAVHMGNGLYNVQNKSEKASSVTIELKELLLRALLKPVKVLYGNMSANMSINGTHWLVTVHGLVETCPGYFSINLTDPSYIDTPIYQFDVGLECPTTFSLHFALPTGDSQQMSKDMQIQVRDISGVYILRVHTTGIKETFEQKIVQNSTSTDVTANSAASQDDKSQSQPVHLSVLFITVVAGVTFLLVGLLVFGVAWKQGIPKGDIQRYRIRHLVLLVVYITFQCLYAIMVTMTMFTLLVVNINTDTTTFLRQYNQQRSVTTALSQLELDDMEIHLWTELSRQNNESQETKTNCYETVQRIIQGVEKMEQSIGETAVSNIKKQSLKDLIREHTRSTFNQFSRELLDFRQKYTKYEKGMIEKLTSQMYQTYQSIQNSKWLKGAKYLHQLVGANKMLFDTNFKMISFMNWVSMQTNMRDLAKGLTLPLPDLFPNLKDDVSKLQKDKTLGATVSRSGPLSMQTLNQWTIQPDIQINRNNRTTRATGKTKRVTTLDESNYRIFIVLMIFVDILWFLHRFIKACGTGTLLLHGYPIYVDAREKKAGNEEKKSNKKSIKQKICSVIERTCSIYRNFGYPPYTVFACYLYLLDTFISLQFIRKGVSSFLIPKVIGAAFVCLMVYLVFMLSYHFINRATFKRLGYHNDMEDIMRINEEVMNLRITAHADRINQMEYKMYEDTMNVNIQTYQHILNLIEMQWRTIEQAHHETFCNYLRRINVTASCHSDSKGTTLLEVMPERCSFPPVLPVLYKRNATSSSKIAGSQLDGFLMNIRKLIADTCYIIAVYLSVVVIKELLGTVLWIYIKRSGIVSLRIIYETNEAPGSADSSTSNK